jgi:tetratricopeptide (TPR) repeat protein
MNSPESRSLSSGISHFDLSSAGRKAAFLALCLLLTGAYSYRVLRSYLASHYASMRDVDSLQRAMRLEPGNAQYADRVGRFFSYARQDVPASVEPYLRAVHLNPHEAQYWLDLANAYQFTGNAQEQGRALDNAVRVDPHTPAIAWQAGNYLLLQGQTQQALRQFRVVVESDPIQADTAISLSWRATHDVNAVVKDGLPPDPEAYLRFLQLLRANDQPDDARTVWHSLAQLHQPIDRKGALSYFDYALSRQDIDEAGTVWNDLLRSNHQLQPYAASDDLIVNGGFEETILNGGFDWRYQPSPSLTISVDDSTVHSGLRSLVVDFNGRSQHPGVFQLVPVQADTEYVFSGYMKAEGLDGANGPRFTIGDVLNKKSYAMTEELMGATPWRHLTASFKTDHDTRLLAIAVVQVPADTRLTGRVWLDDVSLKKK